MRQVCYRIGYELGAALRVLTSEQSLPLWVFITLIYLFKGN